MKRTVIRLLLAASLVASTGTLEAAASSFVTRSGAQLELEGAPYRFTGLNIYNANSTGYCWYAMASGSVLGDSLTAFGPGKSAFRSWFFQSLATSNGQRDWSAFDHTLSVARAHGFKVIPTLANQWPDCEPASGYKDENWYASGYRAPDPSGTVSYRDFVAEVVSRYRDDPTILAWQLVNEAEVKPAPSSGCSVNAVAILKSFATDVSGLVKSLDPNHLVSLGTIGTGQCGAAGAEYQDLHSVATIDLCEYHDYHEPNAPMPGDQWNGLQVRIDQCNALDKPIFVGETGVIPNHIGGTFQARADAFDAKLRAQFAAGVVGELVWAWSALGSTLDNYDVGPGDPVLRVLGTHRGDTGYQTPGSASPLSASLVPVFAQCGVGSSTGNGEHSPPLSVPSCGPPAPTGVAHMGPEATGTALVSVIPGDFATPASEADVRFTGTLDDVRGGGPTGGDYDPNPTGPDLTLVARLRITDLRNGPSERERGTATEVDFPVPVDCAVTAGSHGAICSVDTTADAVMPASIVEGKSAVTQVFRIRVTDSGDNGVHGDGDDRLFAQQGIYVP